MESIRYVAASSSAAAAGDRLLFLLLSPCPTLTLSYFHLAFPDLTTLCRCCSSRIDASRQ
eukprot:767785-Hanusia_phi.AAC.5